MVVVVTVRVWFVCIGVTYALFFATFPCLVCYPRLALMHPGHVFVFIPVVAASIGGITEPLLFQMVHVQCSQACHLNFSKL